MPCPALPQARRVTIGRGYDEESKTYTNSIEELSQTISHFTRSASAPDGVSLFTDETKTKCKSTKQLLEDIADIYSQLSSEQQEGLLEALTGGQHGNAVNAIFEGMDAASASAPKIGMDAYLTQKDLADAADTLDYKLNRLYETSVGIAQNLFQSEDMKAIIDALTSIGKLLDSLTSQLGLFGTVGIGAFAAFNKGEL